jgi:hypothetical protein
LLFASPWRQTGHLPNAITKKKTTVPRHPKVEKFLCDAICKQLDIPKL